MSLLPNKLQFYFIGGRVRGWVTGKNRKIQHDRQFLLIQWGGQDKLQEFNKTKAWLSIIAQHQYGLITSFLPSILPCHYEKEAIKTN